MPILALAAAYLIGSIPFGFLLVRWKRGADVRSVGSGNIGAANVLRTSGWAAGVATFLLDVAKGYAAVWLAGRVTGENLPWMCAAALAGLAGHAFPIFLNFKGGKAMASFTGAFLYLTPIATLPVLVVFLVTATCTRHISMGSILAAATLPLAVWLILHPPLPVLVTALLAGGFVVCRHRDNIRRLRDGTERVFALGRRSR
jgi:glycerol-3-phosphate acyltransferase PlsY